ncbi:MAG: hypothetical protein HN509_10650 [Halobacteriovoraceae bacterium]|jgi:hypothetical protein|nr:hypothetical protein [Halobacteriovoraceae bacterium]MBT5092861.1 hypothetical protein [Halobacteriovoraceae bacterium]
MCTPEQTARNILELCQFFDEINQLSGCRMTSLQQDLWSLKLSKILRQSFFEAQTLLNQFIIDRPATARRNLLPLFDGLSRGLEFKNSPFVETYLSRTLETLRQSSGH